MLGVQGRLASAVETRGAPPSGGPGTNCVTAALPALAGGSAASCSVGVGADPAVRAAVAWRVCHVSAAASLGPVPATSPALHKRREPTTLVVFCDGNCVHPEVSTWKGRRWGQRWPRSPRPRTPAPARGCGASAEPFLPAPHGHGFVCGSAAAMSQRVCAAFCSLGWPLVSHELVHSSSTGIRQCSACCVLKPWLCPGAQA